eukprot:ANDGO_03951.mRNA.1 Cathepsin B-like CP3
MQGFVSVSVILMVLAVFGDFGSCRRLMTQYGPVSESRIPSYSHENLLASLPSSFDYRSAHPHCVQYVMDQGDCSSCWAFSAATSLSDRFCIAGNMTSPMFLSPQDLMDCELEHIGCEMGSLPSDAWSHLVHVGVADMACVPYNGPESQTVEMCTLGKCRDSEDPVTRYKARNSTHIHTVEDMMAEVVGNGPIGVTFNVYSDFDGYEGGVYTKGEKVSWEGLHSVVIVGYDTIDGVPAWIVRNSWGAQWGPYQGYFYIKRGSNECGIEALAYTGIPDLNKHAF